ncbi:MAG TPA: uroporphyrinogen decarboxylase family protein [Chloroflexota bacterium]
MAGTMSGRERILAAMRFEPTDVLPVQPLIAEFAPVVVGMTVREYCTSAEHFARAQIAAYRAVGHDMLFLASDQYYIPQGFGGVYNFPEDETPDQQEPPARELDEVFDLEVPNPYTDGRMPMILEVIHRVRRELGDEVAIRAPGIGVTSLAANLVGLQRFLLELGLVEMEMPEARPDVVTRCFDLAAETLIRWGLACREAGADVQTHGDSLASPDMLSPRTYANWSQPYEKRVITAWKRHGIPAVLHICGNTTPILELMADTGAAFLEIDHKADLRRAKAAVGGRVCLIGNVDPVAVLMQGTPEDVRQAAERCIEVAAANGGYILGTGCHVPRPTPMANLQALVATARAHPNRF